MALNSLRPAGPASFVYWHQRNFAVTARDRATSLSSVGFDAAVWEVWPHLAAGASVHVPGDALRYQPEALRDWLVELGITLSFVPTLLAERLITLNWPSHTALRALLTGADVLHHYPAQALPFAFFNNYGPTECTVVATSAQVTAEKNPDLVPPIGWPIDNTQIYILDEHLQFVTAGSAGELYIGGTGVARGYRNNPQLTADRFIPDPFSTTPGARMYRTGDLGRWLPDGQIAFLGRIDDQVKVRGYRIELNEIVAALDHHPSIEMSFVLARENTSGQKQLVAHVVPRNGSQPSGEELRSFLVSRLPDYMVPEVFVFVPSLPLNANGKVDRTALPMPKEVKSERGSGTAPRIMIEERLRDILQTLLGISAVARDDNFFMLGGNSLLGTQLISRMRDAFEVEVSLLVLFDHSTIEELAVQVENLILKKLDVGQRDSA
jgi:acyl-coenzyme A synthetase/AMP-(fatty) acid ligase